MAPLFRRHVSPCADGVPRDLVGRTVAEAMLTSPHVFTADVRVDELTAFFGDDHVHAALLVDEAGHLVAVVEPGDLLGRPPSQRAAARGRLVDRTLLPHTDLAAAWWAMRHSGRRRLAVVDRDGVLLGLLCLDRVGVAFHGDDHAGFSACDATPAGRPWAARRDDPRTTRLGGPSPAPGRRDARSLAT